MAAVKVSAERVLIVTALTDGFRRAGRVWSTTPTGVLESEFTAQQIAALKAEPRLLMEVSAAPTEQTAS